MMSSLSYLREAYVIHQERRLSRVLPSATPIVQLELFFPTSIFVKTDASVSIVSLKAGI